VLKLVECPYRDEIEWHERDGGYPLEQCEKCFAHEKIDDHEVVCLADEKSIIFEPGSMDHEKDSPPYRV